ncbi:hypothetical protein NSQ77_15530 [Oceanobacillus sp. FSL K6-2867]
MEKQINEKQYDGSEMDEVKSPPFKMIGAFLLLTVIGVLYAYSWSLLL